MKPKIALACALSIFALAAHAEKLALINGTLINPGTERVLTSARILIDGDRITDFGDEITASVSKDARVIDCAGKFILPGYIDTHVHFFQSGDLFTRPDIVDLSSIRPYKDEVAWVKSHVN